MRHTGAALYLLWFCRLSLVWYVLVSAAASSANTCAGGAGAPMSLLSTLGGADSVEAVAKRATGPDLTEDPDLTLLKTLDPLLERQQPKGFENIIALNLNSTNITDEQMTAVAKAKKLRMLELSSTSISDVGLRRISGLGSLQGDLSRASRVWAKNSVPQEEGDPGVCRVLDCGGLDLSRG